MISTGKNWTLFLDRDGVINIEKKADYIHHWDEFVFYPGAAKNVALLSAMFGKTIIVTNQKGIGKGVTKQEDVEDIHRRLKDAIIAEGGHIDGIYYCDATDNDAPCRKPNNGMALQAKQDFPDIDFSRSLMVGNNTSDMQFGRSLGMHTVLLTTTRTADSVEAELVDTVLADLAAMVAEMGL